MVYIALNPKELKKLVKQLVIFYLTSFVFGGCAFALLYFIRPQDVLMKNGVYIGTYPIKIALLGGIVGFVITNIAFKIIKTKLKKKDMIYKIKIQIFDKEEEISAMLDTGNLLRDPISKTPVIIVEKEKHDHQGAAHRHVDIGDIEHRKIDRAEIDEIDDILLTYTVDEITDRTRKNQLAYEQQRQKMPVSLRDAVHDIDDAAQHHHGDDIEENLCPLQAAERCPAVLDIQKVQHIPDDRHTVCPHEMLYRKLLRELIETDQQQRKQQKNTPTFQILFHLTPCFPVLRPPFTAAARFSSRGINQRTDSARPALHVLFSVCLHDGPKPLEHLRIRHVKIDIGLAELPEQDEAHMPMVHLLILPRRLEDLLLVHRPAAGLETDRRHQSLNAVDLRRRHRPGNLHRRETAERHALAMAVAEVRALLDRMP